MTKVSVDSDARAFVLGLIGHILSVFVVVDVAVHSTDVQNREHGHGAYSKDDSCRQQHPLVLANVVRELTENKERQHMHKDADHGDDATMRDNRDLDACE